MLHNHGKRPSSYIRLRAHVDQHAQRQSLASPLLTINNLNIETKQRIIDMQPAQVSLIDGRFCQFLGNVESEASQYPLDLYMDVSDADNLVIHIEYRDFGKCRYPMNNISCITLVQKPVRDAIRAYEDYVIHLMDEKQHINDPEQAFIDKWLL